jgi:hypothetical protein
VPSGVQVPMSTPTAKRMKIALMPVDTLFNEALHRAGSECPRRQPTETATIVAMPSATWFGSTAPPSPKRKYDSPTSRIRAATGIMAPISVSGCGWTSASARVAPVSINIQAILAGLQRSLVGRSAPACSQAVAIAIYSRLDDGPKVWLEDASLVGLEKVRALTAWA